MYQPRDLSCQHFLEDSLYAGEAWDWKAIVLNIRTLHCDKLTLTAFIYQNIQHFGDTIYQMQELRWDTCVCLSKKNAKVSVGTLKSPPPTTTKKIIIKLNILLKFLFLFSSLQLNTGDKVYIIQCLFYYLPIHRNISEHKELSWTLFRHYNWFFRHYNWFLPGGLFLFANISDKRSPYIAFLLLRDRFHHFSAKFSQFPP